MSASASVIVASRGPASRLRALLDSLTAQTIPFEAIVVDNASPDREVERLCDDYHFAVALPLTRNAGFSGPVNAGARIATNDVLVLLNDDCVCEPEFLERICARIDPASGVVMVAGVMRDASEPDLIDSAGMEFDRTLLVYDYLNGKPLDALEGAPDPIGPSAAAAAFDRAAFLQAGGFDERLFAYWEDVDLVLRLLLAGGHCVLAADARGTHEHSATLGSGSSAKNYLMGYGRGYTLRKWRVLTARRSLPILSRELAILAGQAVIDGNAGGLRGRVRGWMAAAPEQQFPAAIAIRGGGDPLVRGLARRLRRRVRRRVSRADVA